MPFVYILRSESTKRLYVGSTMELTSRLSDHNAGNTASTKRERPWKVIYREEFGTLSEARRRERQIKGWKSPEYMRKTLRLPV
jgi:putative endonuclease